MWPWQRPSVAEQALTLLREQNAAQTALLTELVGAVRAQTELAQSQWELMTRPTADPKVRLMTPAVEAQYERQRATPKVRAIDPKGILAGLGEDWDKELYG